MVHETESGLVLPRGPVAPSSPVPSTPEPLPEREEIDLEHEMPTPTGFKMIVELIEPRKVTAGGVHMTDEAIEAQEYMAFMGAVVSMGPLCYKHKKFEGGEPWCKLNDWVAFHQNAGQNITVRGRKFRIINDDHIIAVVPDPSIIRNYVS